MLKFFGQSETRWATMLIGVQETLWSTAPLVASGPLYKTLSRYDAAESWFFIMFSCGCMLIASSMLPWRSGRHIGLFLSCVVWLVTFGLVMKQHGAMSPGMLTFPVMGVFCLLLLINDAFKKANACSHSNSSSSS